MKLETFLFFYASVHEIAHARIAKLFRLQILKAELRTKGPDTPHLILEVDDSSLSDKLKFKLVCIAPSFIEPLVALKYAREDLALYMHIWLRLIHAWPHSFIAELLNR